MKKPSLSSEPAYNYTRELAGKADGPVIYVKVMMGGICLLNEQRFRSNSECLDR